MNPYATTWRWLAAAAVMLCLPTTAQAQLVVQGFDNIVQRMAEGDSALVLAGTGLPDDPNCPNGEDERGQFILSDYTGDHPHGETALQSDWSLFSCASWGGFLQLIDALPVDSTDQFMDWSDFTHVNFWYENVDPPTDPGGNSVTQVENRLLLFDGSNEREPNTREVWYSQTAQIMTSDPGWMLYTLPLEDLGAGAPIPDEGFTLPGWSGGGGNGQLDLDQLVGYALEWTATPIGGDSTASGILRHDKLFLSGARYGFVESFDDLAGDPNVTTLQTGGGGINLATLTGDDAWEGAGTLQMDWTVDANEDWGGFSRMEYNLPSGFYDNLVDVDEDTQASHVSLFFNNVTPPSSPELAVVRIKLHDTSEGEIEYWTFETPVMLGTEAGWQRLLMPLVDRGAGATPDDTGFGIPPWEPFSGNGTLDLDQISGFTVEFVALPDASGQTFSGTMLLDRLTPYGQLNTDNEPPAAPQGLAITQASFSNVVTWNDVAGEEGETYTVYYSLFPITDLGAQSVDVAGHELEEGLGVITQPLVAPLTDQDLTYYYAITATDVAGNTSAPATAGPITNEARGIATVALGAPSGFAADGELGEWSEIMPIRMAPSLGTKIIANTTVDDDDDLSADVYLAAGDDALYLALEVTDDFFEPEGGANPWENDGAEVYIGLYDAHGPRHQGYQRGAEPDYHLRITQAGLVRENPAGGTVSVPGDENFSMTERFPTGYIIEARIPYDVLQIDEDTAFQPFDGMRVPLDIVLQDRDSDEGQQGIMVYSRDNDDNSWESPSNWAFTWLGSMIDNPVSNEPEGGVPQVFELHPNYPNPFSTSTTIAYDLPEAARVTVRVYNVLGQEVATLVDDERPAGQHEVQFEASDLATGTYIFHIRAGSRLQARKMLLVR